VRSSSGQEGDGEAEEPRQSIMSTLAEKAELGVQSVVAVALAVALGVSFANVFAKVGVITFALVSVAVRYTIVGILLMVLVAYCL
jgi:hypothetical protein